ncbi:MAG: leucine-rich repeat domain-containing protein [Akkermansiaceae bacterium]
MKFSRIPSLIVLASIFNLQAGEMPVPKCVYKPTFMTGYDSFTGGTAFICENPVGQGKIMVTAMHLFGPACGLEEQYSAEEIPKNFIAVTGLSMSNNKSFVTSVEPMMVVGSNVDDEDGSSGDIAAYQLPLGSKAESLKLSDIPPKIGDVVYLFGRQRGRADLQSIKAVVESVSEEEIVYWYASNKLNMAGTSGAPVINSKGEVVALNTAGGEQDGKLYGFGNPSASMINMLKKSQNMIANNFTEYALSSELSPDATYTVELLIDRARIEFDPNYWDDWSERSDAREAKGYKPQFSEEDVRPAEKELNKLTWLSLQRTSDKERPVRDLSALRLLPALAGLVVSNNEITDISAIGSSVNLKRLILSRNPISDISALKNCMEIEDLELVEMPIEDFSVLEKLSNLRELTISAEQIPAFKKLKRLEYLTKLEIQGDSFDSFKEFPDMPNLRVIRGAEVKSLVGLEKFTKLENLVNFSGDFDTLEPLANLKALTHINITSPAVSSLKPLSGLLALRDLWLNTDNPNIDLSPLGSLPALHDLTVKHNREEVKSLKSFKATLESWDIEFLAPEARYTPSLEMEVVDQKTFDVFDTVKPFNVNKLDVNEGLLTSELEWLDERIEDVLSIDFEEGEDYTIPFQWGGARSRTVVLLSEEAVDAFPRLVLGIQKVLSTAKKDWIIYFQSEDDDFIVWIYPDKIMVTKEYEKKVRKLIKPN